MKRALTALPPYVLLPLLLLLAVVPVRAQQQAQYSQYMNNNYILNPGATGVEDYIDVKLSYRTQWTGLEGAPKTYYASASSSLGKWRSTPKRTIADRRRPFHAVGGIVYNYVTGPTSRLGVYASYAYNVVLAPDLLASATRGTYALNLALVKSLVQRLTGGLVSSLLINTNSAFSKQRTCI